LRSDGSFRNTLHRDAPDATDSLDCIETLATLRWVASHLSGRPVNFPLAHVPRYQKGVLVEVEVFASYRSNGQCGYPAD
jgi:hypothetical protein